MWPEMTREREREREGPRFRVTTVRKFAALRAAGCLVRLQLPPSFPAGEVPVALPPREWARTNRG